MNLTDREKEFPLTSKKKILFTILTFFLFWVSAGTALYIYSHLTEEDGTEDEKTFDFSGLYIEDPYTVSRLRPSASIDVPCGIYFNDHWPNEPDPYKKGASIHVTVNQRGCRGSDIPVHAPPSKVRILCLGDSNTYGWDLENGQTYPAVLESILNASVGEKLFDVVNAGCPGFNSRQGLILLEREHLALNPDLLIVSFGDNDSGDCKYNAYLPFRFFPFSTAMRRDPKSGNWMPVPKILFTDWLQRSQAYRSLEDLTGVLTELTGWNEEVFTRSSDTGECKTVPLEQFRQNHIEMAYAAAGIAAGPVVLLRLTEQHHQYRQILTNLADDHRFDLCDAYSSLYENAAYIRKLKRYSFDRTKFEEKLTRKGETEVAKLRKMSFTTDGVHLNPSGARFTAEMLFKSKSIERLAINRLKQPFLSRFLSSKIRFLEKNGDFDGAGDVWKRCRRFISVNPEQKTRFAVSHRMKIMVSAPPGKPPKAVPYSTPGEFDLISLKKIEEALKIEGSNPERAVELYDDAATNALEKDDSATALIALHRRGRLLSEIRHFPESYANFTRYTELAIPPPEVLAEQVLALYGTERTLEALLLAGEMLLYNPEIISSKVTSRYLPWFTDDDSVFDVLRHGSLNPSYRFTFPENTLSFLNSVEYKRILLFENRKLLGPAGALHKDIQRYGGGRYSCEGTEIIFSTSDNTNPNRNGRQYEALVLAE